MTQGNKQKTDDLQRTFSFIVHDVARLMRKRLEQRVKAAGLPLTRAQWLVLAWLNRYEGLKQCQLAEFLDVEPITLARHIDNLERMELVERRADPEDRRTRLLFLKPKAAPLLEQVKALAAITRGESMAGIPEADREHLIEMLIKIKSNLTEQTGYTIKVEDRIISGKSRV